MTTPFLLPQKKQPLLPTAHQVDKPDPLLPWQKLDQTNQENQQKQQERMRITPVADSITSDTYTNRMPQIQQIGTSATQGAIESAKTKKAQEEAAALKAWQSQQQAALQAAYNGMNNVQGLGQVTYNQYGQATGGGGGSSSSLWGSGGAQGVANVLRAAGFPESAIPTMVAIAKAESGWNPSAVNNKNRNGSVDNGLFQINTVHKGNSWYPTDVNDPLQNAKAAYAIWQGAGGTYRDWSVYNSGAYKQYLQPAPPIIPASSFTTSTGVVQQQSATASGVRQAAINRGQQYVNSGVGYVWGGNSLLSGVDCSGFVQQIYKAVGIDFSPQVGRGTAKSLSTIGTKSSIANLRPGDFVCWPGSRNGVDHIAVYLGNNQIMESYDSGKPARVRSLGNGGDKSAFGVRITLPGD